MRNLYYIKSLSFIFKYAKFWIFISMFFSIITGIFPLIIVWLSKEIINSVSGILQGNTLFSTNLIILLILQLVVFILQKNIVNIQIYLNTKYEKKLDFELEKQVSEKSSTSPLSYFENVKFHNHLDRIQFNKGFRLMSPINSTLYIFKDIITLVSLFAFLFQYHWALILIILSIVIPIIYLRIKYGKKEFMMRVNQTPESREQFYINALLNNRVSATEVRLFNLKNFLLNRWSYLFNKINDEYLRLVKSREIANANINILSSLLYFIISLFLLEISKKKLFQIGDFVSILQTIQMAENSLTNISKNIGSIYSESLYIKDLFDFIDFKDTNYIEVNINRNKPFSFLDSLEFRDVSFKYPYSEQLALDRVSFKINKGDKIAIVGENGSGKTTLVNCLMGLYPISGGQILIDGVNINDINLEKLHKNITVIFQNYMKYNFSLEKNIILNSTRNLEKLNDISIQSGVISIVNNLNTGFDTVLGKIFLEGEDLSEGQWQKIAIARALYKSGEIFVLDEPTSALDPKAEIEVYKQFDKLTDNKTSIFISHRMASTKVADRIFVFSNGRLIEEGSHQELMSLNKEYTQMYNLQADWYK
ncbi:ABC transporter ATP-binding protein [Psychrobacillus sp. NPDC058041]|uniref:ABC transporter ATP-binding protein n=1 Tax=Psychrobacillus sp. NPDC058041 TaxID=3346310 RepID=UPI0036D8F29A